MNNKSLDNSLTETYACNISKEFFSISILVFSLYFILGIKFNFIIAFIALFALIGIGVCGYQFLKIPALGVAVMVLGTSMDSMGRIGGLPVTVFHLGVFLTFLTFFIKTFYKGKLSFNSTSFDIPLILFLLMIAISLLYTPAKLEGYVHFVRLIALVLTMYVIINAVDTPFGIYISVATLILSAFTLSIISVKSIVGTSSSMMQIAVGAFKVYERFGVTFENPNYFATFLMVAIVLGVSIILNGSLNWIWRISILIILGVILVALMGTFSRAAWLATVPGLLIVINYSKYKKIIFTSGIIVIGFLAVFMWQSVFFQSIIQRLSSLTDASGDPSNSTRVYLFMGGLDMLYNSLLLGVGFRGFPVYYESLYKPPAQALYDVVESHTLPIEILSELGIIGFFLFACIVFLYFKFVLKSIPKIKIPLLKACQIGVVAGMLGYLINSFFSPGGLEGNLLWIGFGLTYAADRIAKNIQKKEF